MGRCELRVGRSAVAMIMPYHICSDPALYDDEAGV